MATTALGRADLHLHPVGNGDTLDDPVAFLAALVAARLDLVGLTDHNRIDVATALAARGADLGVELVVGAEITTREGHVLGLGLRAHVDRDRSLGDTVAAIHEQGGLAIAAHPLLAAPSSASRSVLDALARGRPERRPDALESFNARAAWLPGHRRRVERFAAAAGYAVVGGSDAHRAGGIGRGLTRFPGTTFADLAAAIRADATTAEGRGWSAGELVERARRAAAARGRRRPRR